MSQWWTKYPMPEGWEVKYHWETKRFFYIDHINKKTVWNDPRIELYKGAEGVAQSGDSTLEGISERVSERSEESSNDEYVEQSKKELLRENKAKAILKKFPEFTLIKVTSLLESNYDNEFAVESKLNQELQQLIKEEEAETKRKETEAREKADREKRVKEESERKKLEEENKKRMEEKIKNAEQESKKIAEDAERKRKDEAEKRRKEEAEKKRKEEADKKRKEETESKKQEEKRLEEVKKESDLKKINDTEMHKKPPLYENYQQEFSSQSNNSSQKMKKSINQKGPNKSLFSGANPQNYKGPNLDLLSNSVGTLAKGPDPLNRCGPQLSYRS